MFEIATREKYRFPYKGQIGVEDLWDLSVGELDKIYKALNRQAKQINEESLLAAKSKEDKVLDNKINIIRHIVSVKLDEIANAKAAHERTEQKQKIMAILANKQDEELRGKSADELKAMLAELD